MKYSYDTYALYRKENRFSFVVRTKVTMKDTVDGEVLRTAVNKAMTRYPYFSVEVKTDASGAYVLVPNAREAVVLPVSPKTPKLCSEEVNRHLLFVEYEGRDIYFNISHAMCGGCGLMPWVMTCVWQYVADRYGVTPDAPSIRKPGSPLLPGETSEPSLDMLPDEAPIYEYKSKNPKVLLSDYMNGLFNPFKRDPNYRVFTFQQKEIMKFAKENDASVAAFFLIAVAKALDKILPSKVNVIGGEMAHNLTADIGIPHTHCDILSHIHIDYTREQLETVDEKLGTMTRGQIILQTDPSVSCDELRRKLELYEKIDSIDGLRNKIEYMSKHNAYSGKGAKHGTYYVNYTGQLDWGEVAEYVESYVLIVEGHLLIEVTSMSDKIFVCFMQLIKEDKYANAFCAVMKELGISYQVEGPFPKNLPKHQLP